MRAIANRYKLIAAVTLAAGLSQLQGQVNGPLPLLLTAPPIPLPFVQSIGSKSDPLIRAYPTSLRTWTQNLLDTTLAPPQVTALAAGRSVKPKWPTSHIAILRTPTQSLLQTTLATQAPSGTPQVGAVLDVPRGAVYPISLRTIAQSLIQTTLADQSAIPETCGWGNPPTRVFPTQLLTWVQTQIPPATQTPTVNYDRPNPLRARFPVELLTWTQSPDPPPAITPAALHDWPNPRGYSYPTSLRTWSQSPPVPAPVPGHPATISLVGNYITLLSLTGNYQITLTATGNYATVIVLTGST